MLVALLIVLAAALLPLLVSDGFILVFLANTLLFGMEALGLQLIFGAAGMIVLCQAAFAGVGAYTAALLAVHFGWPFWLTAPAGVLAAIGAGLVMAPIIRLREVYFAMATFAFGAIAAVLLRELPFTGGVNGLPGIDPPVLFGYRFVAPGPVFELVLAVVAVEFWLFRRLLRGSFGLALNAIRQNDLAARAVGISVTRLQVKAIVAGVAAAGAAGALIAHTQGFISPDMFRPDQSLFVLGMVVVGGLNSLPGSLLGALAIMIVSEYIRGLKELVTLIYGGILVAFMALLPRGLWGLGQRLARTGAHRFLVPGGAAQAPPAPPPAEGVLLQAEALGIRFGGVTVLSDVNLKVAPGEIHGLIGPNGAGKTTLLNVLFGFYRPTAGRIRFAGQELAGRPAHLRPGLGLARTFQSPQIWRELTVFENVALGCFPSLPTGAWRTLLGGRGARRALAEAAGRATWALQFVGLEGLAAEPAGNLAYGQKKLLEIARALAGGPRLLLLDEPAAGLNQGEAVQLTGLIRRIHGLGIAVLIIEHNMQLIMGLCQQITVLDFGAVIAVGTPEEVRRHPRVLSAYLGRSA